MNPLEGPFVEDNASIHEIISGIQGFPGIQSAPLTIPNSYYAEKSLGGSLALKVIGDLHTAMTNSTGEFEAQTVRIEKKFSSVFTEEFLKDIVEKIVRSELKPFDQLEEEIRLARREQIEIEKRLETLESKNGL